jgi:hypothetical protein
MAIFRQFDGVEQSTSILHLFNRFHEVRIDGGTCSDQDRAQSKGEKYKQYANNAQ